MESERAQGISDAIREEVGPRATIPIQDSHDRKFMLNLSGDIGFSPAGGNGTPVVPSTVDAEKHLSEANALFRLGEKENAVALWKSLAAMGSPPDAPGHLRRVAAEAARRLNRVGERADFRGVDASTDPYVYYDGTRGRTILRSDLQGWKMELPGSWRFRRDPRRRRGDEGSYSVVYLKHGTLLVAVASESLRIAGVPGDVAGYVSLWDTRRGVTEALKREKGFVRKKHPESNEICAQLLRPGTEHSRSLAPDPPGATENRGCYLAESGTRPVQGTDGAGSGSSGPGEGSTGEREFYFLRADAGFFLLIGPVPLDENIFLFIMKHIQFH